MKFHLITTVWGNWHLDAMERVMLPTLLAEKNLPALRSFGEVRYLQPRTGMERRFETLVLAGQEIKNKGGPGNSSTKKPTRGNQQPKEMS